MAIDVPLLFAVLGPAFLLVGVWRWWGTTHARIQARTWLLLGSLFSLAAAGLHWVAPGGR
jgi:hypothetical protein